MPKVYVKKSKIQGKGVFANMDFKARENILAIDDPHIVKDFNELRAYQKEFQCDWLGNGKTVLMQSPERYINHSCDPNSYVKTVKGKRQVLAMRNIKKGEEITYDYVINGYYDSAIKCRCGSKNCRKILNNNFFKLNKKRQKEYLPYLDSWFKRKFSKELKALK